MVGDDRLRSVRDNFINLIYIGAIFQRKLAYNKGLANFRATGRSASSGRFQKILIRLLWTRSPPPIVSRSIHIVYTPSLCMINPSKKKFAHDFICKYITKFIKQISATIYKKE